MQKKIKFLEKKYYNIISLQVRLKDTAPINQYPIFGLPPKWSNPHSLSATHSLLLLALYMLLLLTLYFLAQTFWHPFTAKNLALAKSEDYIIFPLPSTLFLFPSHLRTEVHTFHSIPLLLFPHPRPSVTLVWRRRHSVCVWQAQHTHTHNSYAHLWMIQECISIIHTHVYQCPHAHTLQLLQEKNWTKTREASTLKNTLSIFHFRFRFYVWLMLNLVIANFYLLFFYLFTFEYALIGGTVVKWFYQYGGSKEHI